MTAEATLPPGFPAMTVGEAHALINQPGGLFEIDEIVIRGVRTRIWKNAPATLAAVWDLGAAHADKTYLVYEKERVTFAMHAKAVAAMGKRLQAEGVVKGDRVAIIMRNLPEWSAAFWAASLIGAIVTPLNAWWTGLELEYGLVDSGATVAILDHERWERVREHVDACPALTRMFVSRAAEEISDPRVVKLESVLGAVPEWDALPVAEPPRVALASDDDATIFYTSGTTGKPKGAVITHRNIVSNFFNAASAQARSFLRRGEQPPAPDPDAPQRVVLLSVPFFHATGCFAVMIPAMYGGARIVLQRKWDAEQALGLIERERVTQIGGVPTIAWQVIEHPRAGEFDLSSIEAVA